MTETTRSRPRRRTNSKLARELFKYAVSACILGAGIGIMLFLKTLAVPPETVQSDALVPLVATFDAIPYDGQLDMVVSGSVVPFREIKIASEVSGQVKTKFEACQAGNFVTKGTPLIKIDTEEFDLEINSIQADVNQSKKSIKETEEEIQGAMRNLELAKDDYRLQMREYQRNNRLEGVLSRSEIDAAKRAMLASKTQLTARENTLKTLAARKERLLASLELSKSQMDKAQLNLKRTLITAPDDGIVVRDMIEQGDYVSRGTQLVMFEDTRRSEVLCNLTATDLDWIRKHSTGSDMDATSNHSGNSVYRLPKTPVSIYETSDPSIVWHGVLERFDGIGRDELTKSIPCRIVVSEPVVETETGQRALVRGMYVKCRMEVQTSTAAPDQKFLAFPEVALRPGDHVWVVRDEVLAKIDVEVADHTSSTMDNQVEPFVIVKLTDGGLQVDDRVVVTPLSQPTEGAKVLLDAKNDAAKPDTKKTTPEATVNTVDETTTS